MQNILDELPQHNGFGNKMDKNLTAALIIIGNEILSGRTQDANTPWIATKLADHGIKLVEARTIPDIEDVIVKTVNELRSKVKYVFTTGGIGPTHDDITTASIAKAFGVTAQVHPEARAMLAQYYGGEEHLTDARLKMATIPEGAILVDNPASGAPGFQIDNVIVMAGVPRIMQAMLHGVLSRLESGAPYLSNIINCSLLESVIAKDLSDIQNKFPMVDVGSYPHFRQGDLSLSLVLRSSDNANLHAATNEVVAMVRHHGQEPSALSITSVAPR